MLPIKNRITKSTDISTIKTRGQKIDARQVVVYCQPGSSPVPRFAFVVGKHVHKSAVVRHKYQRWMRAIARDLIPRLSEPFDMVWVARPGINHAERRQIFQNVEGGLMKGRIISDLPPAK